MRVLSFILSNSSLWSNKLPLSVGRLHTSIPLSVKEIITKKEGNQTIIETKVHDSERKKHVIKTEHDAYACPVCRLNLDIKHTDVLILSQFVRKDGCMLPKRITGLCNVSQIRISKLVSMAHIAGLMPNLVPKYSKKDCTKRRRDWKKYNTYFDESTIKPYDTLRKDKFGLKEKFYESLGFTWNKEPWKDRPKLEVQPKKLVHY